MNVTVVGSISVDLVTRCGRYPARGESIRAESFAPVPGGKGANQAVACARMGCRTTLIGAVGTGPFAELALGHLETCGVDLRHVLRSGASFTGTATILIDDESENTILVTPGANHDLTPARLEDLADVITRADALLVQLEVSLPVVERAMQIARRAGVPVLLDPAPARPVPDACLALADFLTPNEQETRTLTGLDATTPGEMRRAARALHDRGARQVVLKRGRDGCFVSTGARQELIAGLPVKPLDTVGAGDCFAGALVARWLESRDLFDACRFANAAASLKVRRSGAQTGIPSRAEVDALLQAA